MKKSIPIRNEYYTHHLTDKCKDVPDHILKNIVRELSTLAEFNMGNETEDEVISKLNDGIVNLLKSRFSYLPLHLIGEAYIRGSLGELGGTTRLIPRTVFCWLNAISEKAQNLSALEQGKRDDERREAEERAYKLNQKHNCLFGTAMRRKTEMICAGNFDFKDYDTEYSIANIVKRSMEGSD